MIVTGRTAPAYTACSASNCFMAAVSTFLITTIGADGETTAERVFGHACDRHIIGIHDAAEKAADPQLYVRGTRTGRVNATHVPIGAKILTQQGAQLIIADRKTGAAVATVQSKRKGGGFRCYILVTDLGEITTQAAATMWTVA